MINKAVISVSCALLVLFAIASTASAQTTTALYVDSQTGDPVGRGLNRTYLPPDATVSVSGSTSTLYIYVSAPSAGWNISLGAPSGGSLAPGTYLQAVDNSSPGPSPYLDVYGNGGSCSPSTGRFTIRELVKSGSTLTALAVDFEQHCSNGDPALFGSLRYQSTVATLIPFDGAYPDYRLTVQPPAHGTITGDGIACSATQSSCTRTLAVPAALTLTATPDAGYMFLGWQGACSGLAPASVRVNQPVECSAVFDSTSAPSPRTQLYFDSRPGDPLGKGSEYFYDTSKGSFSIDPVTQPNGPIYVRFSGLTYWNLTFTPGQDAWVAPSTYFFGVKSIYTQTITGLEISGGPAACTIDSGRFTILELDKGSNGTVNRFAADFEVHCQGSDPGFFGSVRYNSLVYAFNPFNGAYPQLRLDVVPAAHGVVTGGGISCGPGQSACSQTPATPVTVTLTATPDAGYVFLGWKGSCSGRGVVSAVIRINQPVQCEALFDSLSAPSLRTGLFFDSQTGDYVGQGRKWLYSTADGKVGGQQNSFGNRAVQFSFQGATYWYATFDPGANGWRVPGAYYNATGSSGAPKLDVYGDGRSCSQPGGSFYVYELVIANDGSVVRFAADFEQHCQNGDVAMYGSVRFNSTVPWLAPFNGAYPNYVVSVAKPMHGLISGGSVTCSRTQSACTQYFGAPASITLTATPDAGYTFTGWRGDCSGTGPSTVRVNMPRQCQALFRGPATVISSDTDGDAADDLAIWRASTGTFNWATSSSAYASSGAKQWGSQAAGDVPFMADMDGDGKSDLVIWRASTGTWYWLGSAASYSYGSPTTVQWGNSALGDVPLMADMDGDGRGDLVIWRASSGTFFWITSTTNYATNSARSIQWGNKFLGDKPLLGDFDGDGQADLGIWRGSTGTWYWLTSTTMYSYASAQPIQWGNLSLGDVPFAGDLDGDGKADPIVWRASTGTWYWLTSSTNFSYGTAGARQFGSLSLGDVPLLKDLDGDGLVDLTVWRASTAVWYWLTSGSGFTGGGSRAWGLVGSGDIPIGR